MGWSHLSEIRFDLKHEHAILWYGFRCVGLCGNGGTVVLEKKSGVWKRGKPCSIWMSQLALPTGIAGKIRDERWIGELNPRVGRLGL